MEKNKISVIIATYKRDDVLCNTLGYLFAQDDECFEIIVVDQTIHHNKYTEAYLSTNKDKFKYVYSDDANLPAARNLGIRYSMGSYVVFFDDDMILPINTLSTLRNVFTTNPNVDGLTFISASSLNNSLDAWNTVPRNKRDDKWIKKEPSLYPIKFLPGFCMAFKRDLIDQIGYFDEWIGTQPKSAFEDGDFCLRARLQHKSLYIFSGLTIVHLAEQTGGCEVRVNYSQNIDKIRFQQYRMVLQSAFKNKHLFSSILQYWIFLLKTFHNYFSSYGYDIKSFPKILLNFSKLLFEKNARTKTTVNNQN